MKVLFAVNNESISESIIKQYQQEYKEIISSKNVYYFDAIVRELQKDKTYDRIVISEDVEPFTNNNYGVIDNFIFKRLDNISDEATTTTGQDIPIILICADRRTKSENFFVKLFGIGIYSALIGQDRTTTNVCKLINTPRSKKDAKIYYRIDSDEVDYKSENGKYLVDLMNSYDIETNIDIDALKGEKVQDPAGKQKLLDMLTKLTEDEQIVVIATLKE